MATGTALDLDVLARIGRALADPSRRRMLVALLDGARHAGDLAEVSEGTLANASNHLACLRDCGIVVAHGEGRRVSYELANPSIAKALRILGGLDLTPDCDCH